MAQIYDIIVVNEADGCLNAVTNQYTITGCNQTVVVKFDGTNNAVGPFDIYTGSTGTTAIYTGVTRTEMIYGVVLTLTDPAAFCGTPTPTPSTAVSYVVNMTLLEVGGNVVLSGSGTLDTTSLGTPTLYYRGSNVTPTGSQFGCGVPGPPPLNCYIFTGNTLTSPANFGTGGQSTGDSGTGDFFGIGFYNGNKNLFIPTGYVSGSFISGSTTFSFTTLAAMGATSGTYTWSGGSGANASSIILQVG